MSDAVLKSGRIKLAISIICFLFTFALVLWWWIFSFMQLHLLVDVLTVEKFDRLHRMLVWEGSVLVLAIFSGGLFLVILMNREVSRNYRLRNFFSNFTHDLKTSLSRVRLSTEVLASGSDAPELQKILEEVNRLDLQLENSLWIGRNDSDKLRIQTVSLNEIIGFLRMEWPELKIKLNSEAKLKGDEQALRSIFRNIFQNAWLHGQAKEIEISPNLTNGQWRIEIQDNGIGFSGDYQHLGSQILKSKSKRGNGIGLFLAGDLIRRMQGKIQFTASESGFKIEMYLPAGEMKNA
jgi:signal transduction histidine kinase